MDYQIENEILIAIGSVNQKVDRLQEDIYEMKKQVAKIPEIEKQVAKIPEMQKEIAKIAEMQREIAQLQKETRNISRSVAVIEHEHGDKLKALFDVFTAHTEKMEKQDNQINFCEHKLDDHTAEIDYLKTKVQGL